MLRERMLAELKQDYPGYLSKATLDLTANKHRIVIKNTGYEVGSAA